MGLNLGVVFGAVGHWFESFWKGISGQLQISLESFLKSFVQDDLGKLAVDAVNYAQTFPGFAASTDIEKRNAAKSKLKTDLEAAGHDITKFTESLLNFLIETALQAVRSGIVTP